MGWLTRSKGGYSWSEAERHEGDQDEQKRCPRHVVLRASKMRQEAVSDSGYIDLGTVKCWKYPSAVLVDRVVIYSSG